MRLGTCIAVEILVGVGSLSALGAGSAWGVAELRGYLERSDRQAAEEIEAEATQPDPVGAGVGAAAGATTTTTTSTSTSTTGVEVARVKTGVSTALDTIGERPAPEAKHGEPLAVAVEPAVESPVVRVEPEKPYVAPAPEPEVADDTPAAEPGRPAWHRGGKNDRTATAPLLDGAVAKVKLNRGGMTLSLRIDFDNGARAAFKPQQTNPQSNPRREIAAYRIDRLLGLDRVSPAVARTFTVDEIVDAIPDKAGKARFREEAVTEDGMVTGELSWWIPVIADGKVDGYSIDSRDGIVTWKRFLRAGATIPNGDRVLVRQISDMIVFDFLIDNIDRWSGNNAKTSSDGRVLYFMDNTFAFGTRKRGHAKSQTYLSRVQTFSKKLIAKLRGLSADDIRAAIADDKGDFDLLLTSSEIAALMSRREIILDYVDGLIAKYGEDKVLAFP